MFICEICVYDWYFPKFCKSDLSTDISKCFRGSLRLRDNESRLYIGNLGGVVVLLWFYIHGNHLWSCKDGQLTKLHFSLAGLGLLSS